MAHRAPPHARPCGSRVACAVLLLIALGTASCAGPWAPAAARPTATATASPLARTTLYWSVDQWLLALRSSDGKERWRVGNWTQIFPNGQGTAIFGPSDPVVADGTLFATAPADHTGIPTAYAFDPTQGSIRWQTPLAGCLGAGAGPLVADGVLYVALTGRNSGSGPCGSSGWVFALRAADGTVLWRRPFARDVFPSLALTAGVLIVLNDNYPTYPQTNYLTGLRLADGTPLWQVQRTDILDAYTAADGVVVLNRSLWTGAADQATMEVEALRAADGVSVWQAELPTHLRGDGASIANGLVYVHSDLGYLYALRLTDGSTAWRFQTGVRFVGEPVLVNSTLYVGAGPNLLALDPASGALVRTYALFGSSMGEVDGYQWRRPLITGSAIFVAGAAIIPSIGGAHALVDLFALDQASGRMLWQYPPVPPDTFYSAPVALEMPVDG